MNTVILGGTGFIGTALSRILISQGHTVIIPSRNPKKTAKRLPEDLANSISLEQWDGTDGASLATLLDNNRCNALVNLLGHNIAAGRWTQKQKDLIVGSRVKAGQAVIDAFRRAQQLPQVLIQASAIGYYGTQKPPTNPMLATEGSPPGSGFLADTAVRWEASTLAAAEMGVRRVVIRTGMVLGQNSGALPKFVTPFRLFAGGPLGSGLQEISWIHIDDEVRAIAHLIGNSTLHGTFNLTAPEPVTMHEFCTRLGTVLNRPSWLRTPAWALELLMGEMASELITNGRRVHPDRLIASGFDFLFPTLAQAFADLFLAHE